jgi:hypothetical protein
MRSSAPSSYTASLPNPVALSFNLIPSPRANAEFFDGPGFFCPVPQALIQLNYSITGFSGLWTNHVYTGQGFRNIHIFAHPQQSDLQTIQVYPMLGAAIDSPLVWYI